MRLLNTAPPDTVTGLLSAVAVRSSVYCLSDLGAPWGFEVDGAAIAKFHVVLEGGGWLQLAGAEPVWLGTGDLAILPRGERHAVRSAPDSPVTSLNRLIAEHPPGADARMTSGGDGARTRLLCGGFTLTSALPGPLLSLLPPVVTVGARAAPVSAWIGPVFDLAREEATSPAPGAQVIFAKLADVLLSQALRTYLTGAAQAGLFPLVPRHDPQIERAAALLRDQPARPWTLQALAREAGMSRTLFATRFRASVGESPMRHLAKIRLGQAAGYLATADISLDAIAARTGYASNASLSKAFKRHFGVSPGAYRTNHMRTPAQARQLTPPGILTDQ